MTHRKFETMTTQEVFRGLSEDVISCAQKLGINMSKENLSILQDLEAIVFQKARFVARKGRHNSSGTDTSSVRSVSPMPSVASQDYCFENLPKPVMPVNMTETSSKILAPPPGFAPASINSPPVSGAWSQRAKGNRHKVEILKKPENNNVLNGVSVPGCMPWRETPRGRQSVGAMSRYNASAYLRNSVPSVGGNQSRGASGNGKR